MNQYQSIRRTHKRRISEINVVPYIDVMLVLLVIFMVTAPLLTEGVKVELPNASARPMDKTEEAPLVITVDAKGAFYLNVGEKPDRPVDEQTLINRVAAVLKRHPQTNVFVRGDRRTDYGRVMAAMVLLQKAGVNNVGLVTRSPDKRG